MMQLLCLGDIALSHPQLAGWKWLPPAGLKPGADVKILFNWELPIGDSANPTPRSSGPRLLSDPAGPGVLQLWAPGFAALATNHILDAEEDGLVHTITALRRHQFEVVGAGMAEAEISRPLIWETTEGKLAIINWVFPETHPEWMHVPGPNCWPGLEKAQNLIRALKAEVDWVMVLPHWSDELFAYPRAEDRETAKALAEAGADLIVCHHPHVVRGMELIGKCPVFYSLGNYYFSEFSSGSGGERVQWAPRSREALGILLTFEKGSRPEIQPLSFWQEKEQTEPDPKSRAVRRMAQTSRALMQYQGAAYEAWYRRERLWFDRVSARWHFGARRLGVMGSLRYAWSKLIRHL